MVEAPLHQSFPRVAAERGRLLAAPGSTATRRSSFAATAEQVVLTLEFIRKLATDVAVITVVVIVLVVACKAVLEPSTIFEPLRLSAAATTSDHDGTVLTERIISRAREIAERTRSAQEVFSLDSRPRREALAAIKVPSSEIDLTTIVTFVGDLFDTGDVRISGILALPSATTNQYVLQLTYRGAGKRRHVEIKHSSLDELLTIAAESVVEYSAPYILALHYEQGAAWEKMDRLIDRMLADGRTSPSARLALMVRGLAFLDQRNNAEAISYFQQVIELDERTAVPFLDMALARRRHRDRAQPYNNWGVALARTRDISGAKAKFQKAASFDDGHAPTFYNWGSAFFDGKDYKGAIRLLRRATELDPRHASAFYNLGNSMYQIDDYDGAIECYRRVVELKPEHDRAWNNWGEALIKKKDFPGAIAKYRRAAEIAPLNGTILANWSEALQLNGQVEEAKSMRERAKRLSR